MDWKNILSDHGMTMKSGHTVFGQPHWDGTQVTDLWKTTVEDAVTAGQDYIISPWLISILEKISMISENFSKDLMVQGHIVSHKVSGMVITITILSLASD